MEDINKTTGEIVIATPWDRHRRIVGLRNLSEKTFLALGQALYEFHYNNDYESLGYETFESYLADPEVDIGRSLAFMLINIHKTFILKLGVHPDGLLPVGVTKLDRLAEKVDDTNVEAWLNKAATLSRSDLVKEINTAFPPKPPPPLPDGKFRVIYADPPWKYSDELIQGYGAATHHYPVMTIEELCNCQDANGKKISDLPGNDAVLFMWTTSPVLDECFEVIKAWGFEYKSSFIWDKISHNYGHYNSVRHELLLVCTKGSCLPDKDAPLFDSVQSIQRTKEHSEKPEEFRKIINTLYPEGKRVELFARKKVEGWDVWGNEPSIN